MWVVSSSDGLIPVF